MDDKTTNRILDLQPVGGEPVCGTYIADGQKIGYEIDPASQEIRLHNLEGGQRLTRKYPI
ncbi:MAG: hypothetical protein ABIJ92_01475 [Candidatus Aenigmatarchaeota archaeon]